jgi:hypothetical protein
MTPLSTLPLDAAFITAAMMVMKILTPANTKRDYGSAATHSVSWHTDTIAFIDGKGVTKTDLCNVLDYEYLSSGRKR